MRIYLLIWLMLFTVLNLRAQQAMEIQKQLDLGNIGGRSIRYGDFRVYNRGSEPLFLLRADPGDDCSVKFLKQEIAAGDSGLIRVQINPESKGKFSRRILIYHSAAPKPEAIELRGNVIEIPDDIAQECPDFSRTRRVEDFRPTVFVLVLDKYTDRPLAEAQVQVMRGRERIGSFMTDKQGLFSFKAKSATTHTFVSTHEGYADTSRIFYGFLPQDTLPVYMSPQRSVTQITTTVTTRTTTTITTTPPKDTQSLVQHTLPKPVAQPLDLPGELSRDQYRPNNIVFLIDVSSSMAGKDRLPLLKESMKKLIYALRDIDRVSVITYADGTDVVVESAPADRKRYIARRIDRLEASGGTEGRKAIDLAYVIAQHNLLSGGNNQIYLATDGDFRLGKKDQELYDILQDKVKREGIHMSVIGFGREGTTALNKMRQLSAAGGGSFVHIGPQEQSADLLLTEIRQQSKR